MGSDQAAGRRLDHLGARAEEIGLEAAPGGQRDRRFHQVDAGHPARQGAAEQAGGQNDARAVGGDEIGAEHVAAKLGIAAHGHQLGGVERHRAEAAAGRHRRRDQGQRLPGAGRVDRTAKYVDAGRTHQAASAERRATTPSSDRFQSGWAMP